MLAGRYIHIYLAVYSPEIIGGFGFEEKSQKMKAVCSLGRKNYGGLWNVQPPIIDPLRAHHFYSGNVLSVFSYFIVTKSLSAL